MAEITKTEISYVDEPVMGVEGTSKSRLKVYIRDAAVAAGETLNLATYIPGVSKIEGIVYESDDGAAVATASTWSTSTLTIGAGTTGLYEACLIARYD